MAKYMIQKKGHGKYEHGVPRKISETRAMYLKQQGVKVYDSLSEAKEDC